MQVLKGGMAERCFILFETLWVGLSYKLPLASEKRRVGYIKLGKDDRY